MTKKTKILLIDDDPLILMTLLHYFCDKGYAVAAANSPDLIVSKIDPHEFDVVITDYRMEPIDGIEMIRNLRNKGFAGKIILVSALCGLNKQALDELRVDAFFEKPFDIDGIHKKIKEWTGGHNFKA